MPKGIKGFQKGHTINVGKKYSESRKSNISKALKGRIISMEWRQKMSLSHIGNNQLEVTKLKISKTMIGKSTIWLTGRKLSEEQKKKISLAGKGRIVSLETRRKIRIAQLGEKANNWKGGLTPEKLRIRKSLEYKLWREAIFKRDNYTCTNCNIRSGNGSAVILHADHIKPFAFYPELRFELSNGRTLCIDCHKKTDTYGGKARCKTLQ